jgi:hypothetical protein
MDAAGRLGLRARHRRGVFRPGAIDADTDTNANADPFADADADAFTIAIPDTDADDDQFDGLGRRHRDQSRQ